MKLDRNKRVLIVGLGLLGGSYAMALKRQGYTVSAITRDPGTIAYALENGLIDQGTAEIDGALIAEADIVVFALYPHVFTDWIRDHGHLLRPGTVVTDVTGVKSCLVYNIQRMLPAGVEFISAHPMAGREVSGIRNCDDGIFCNANYIVVPTEANTQAAVELCKDLGETLGFAHISVLTP